MKAMILAAGLGTRLRELTATTPKCLIEVGGKTLLEHTVEALKRAGVTEVAINLHYLADKVREFVAARNNFGLKVHLSYEPTLLDTGGGVKQCQEFLSGGESFFIHNSDVYSEINLRELLRIHRENKNLFTLSVMTRESSRGLLFDSKMQLFGWQTPKKTVRIGDEKTVLTAFGFSGIQLCSPEIFKYMPSDGAPFSIIETLMSAAKAGEKIRGVNNGSAYWIDAGTLERVEMLKQHLK